MKKRKKEERERENTFRCNQQIHRITDQKKKYTQNLRAAWKNCTLSRKVIANHQNQSI